MYLKNLQTYNTFVYEVEEDDSLKNVLIKEMRFSSRLLRKIKREGNITLDNRKMPTDFSLKKGDIIRVKFKDEISNYKEEEKKLQIYYEDEDIILLEKMPFTPCHPTKSCQSCTLLNYLLYYFKEKNIHSRPRFISRLDYNTSGIIAVSKNGYAHYQLSEGDYSSSMKKTYTAIVHGTFEKKEGVIDMPIAKSEDGIHREVREDGKRAVTHYKVMQEKGDFSVVKFLLKTGRTHQIRVHMNAVGHPIAGDTLYGSNLDLGRQALHASELEIISPRNQEKIKVHSKLKEDINFLKI